MKKFIIIFVMTSLTNITCASNNIEKKYIEKDESIIPINQPALDVQTKLQLLTNSVQIAQKAQNIAQEALEAYRTLDNSQITPLGAACCCCLRGIIEGQYKIADRKLEAAQKIMTISVQNAELIKLMER